MSLMSGSISIEAINEEANKIVNTQRDYVDDIVEKNTKKVLDAFRENKISEQHLKATTGYGYDDIGRDGLEALYATLFQTEDALVRQQIVSGTHAISLAYFGNLRPGDELLAIGRPYDTLQKVIGYQEEVPGSLKERGIGYREVLIDYENIDTDKILSAFTEKTKMVTIQRSKGYEWRPSLDIKKMALIIKAIKEKYPHVIIFVDNCYGELVEELEPTQIGADLVAGSLIKNLGGSLTPTGGYLAGKKTLVENAAYFLNVPGGGKEVGCSLIENRLYYQGLFLAPGIVGEALAGAIYAAAFWQALGYEVCPLPDEKRTDIIQAIKLNDKDKLLAFCRGIQKYAPIDSFVTPEPWAMPGYNHPVIMAAGAFVQGASIELSADAPVIAPYQVFFQGGLNRYHVKIAIENTAKDMLNQGLLK